MSINFNKLFLQDIIARRGSHAIDLGEGNEQSDDEDVEDFGSDYYNDSSSDTLEETNTAKNLQKQSLFDMQTDSNSPKNRLLEAIQELRVAVDKQNSLHNQLNGRLGHGNKRSFTEVSDQDKIKSSKPGEKESTTRTTETNQAVPMNASSVVTSKQTEDQSPNKSATSSILPIIKESKDIVPKVERSALPTKPQTSTSETSVKKRLTSQSNSTEVNETDLSSFKRCERLSKRKEKVIVEIRVVFLKIGEIDTLKEIYHADAFIQAKWREPRLDGKLDEDLRRIDLQRCWNPLILIDNILSESKDQHWMLTQKSENNEVYIVERRRLRGIFLETLELNDFPLDVQDLTITLTSERPDSEIVLVPDRSELCGINLQTLVDQQEWKLHEHIEVTRRSATQEYTNSSQSHPCISVTCRAARRPGYFYWNVFLIMFFITGLSFATFAVPPERPENRLQLSFTLFLTSVAFKFVINQSLPKISYLTYMDKYVLMSLAILCVVSIWHAMVTLIPTEAVFEQEDMLNMLKFSSLGTAAFGQMDSTNDTERTSTTTTQVTTSNMENISTIAYQNNSTNADNLRTFSVNQTTRSTNLVSQINLKNSSLSRGFGKPNLLAMWNAEQWKQFAQQSTDMEQEKRALKLRIERDVFASFCVLYALAHLTFVFWLYFDASKRRREMVERDRQYKRCLQASKAV